MKLFLVAAVLVVATADRLENTYLPPNSAGTAGGHGGFLNAPRPGASAPSHSGPTSPPVAILRLNNDNNGDGSYKFDFETENHITQQESGQLKNAGSDQEINVVQGSYSYAGPDGQTYTVNYVADENGFRPEGAHLPVAPAVPAEIAEALQKNAADEAAGIVDDGQYRPEHQGAEAGGAAVANRQYLAPRPSSNQQGGYKY